MKTPFATLVCFAVLSLSFLHAADSPSLAAVQAADDARIAAMTSGSLDSLDAVLSDDLHYAHSSGNVDSKKSFLEALVAGKLKYSSYQNEERNFTFPAPSIALMTGRTHVKVVVPTGVLEMDMSYLGVWREEGGKWRFLAWQSCKLPPTKAP